MLSYALNKNLKTHPPKVMSQWKVDLGSLTGDQWEETFQSVTICSLNVSQRLLQLYILFWVHFTPLKLYKMGKLTDPLCGKWRRVPGHLIHLLWHWPKLHWYWSGVLSTLNWVFQTAVPLDLICCLLGVLEKPIREETGYSSLCSCLISGQERDSWKLATPPTIKTWVTHMGNTLLIEWYIYQHAVGDG